MATLDSIPWMRDFITELVEKKDCTHKVVSAQILNIVPQCRGLSAASVRRFCDAYGIRKNSRMDDEELDTIVANAVSKVNIPSKV